MSIRRQNQVTSSPQLVGYVEQSKNAATTYTIAPEDAAGYDLMSQWITASATVVECLDSKR